MAADRMVANILEMLIKLHKSSDGHLGKLDLNFR